ncbi:MAG: uracil-DNA glycosylase [Anaerolineae bacterium]|nr:uracil-DNA glycosylase [Gemmatimonadaceae bacterium]
MDRLSVDEVLRIVGAFGRGRAEVAPQPDRDALPVSIPSISDSAPASIAAIRPDTTVPAAESAIDGWRVVLRGPAAIPPAVAPPAPTASPEERLLGEIREEIRSCTRCPLYATATNPVPGEGSSTGKLVCVGEAPGASEDQTGRPFVGQAGQLLTKILAAINLSREEVFIVNVLKHRPPGNRNPLPEEVEACRPYLTRQLEVIKPKVIVALGTFAAQTLLETKLPIGKLRGQVHEYLGIPVVVTYHPAALLRNSAWKRPTWEDVQLARRILDSSAA